MKGLKPLSKDSLSHSVHGTDQIKSSLKLSHFTSFSGSTETLSSI